MKKLLFAVMTVAVLIVFAACGSPAPASADITIAALAGPTGMGVTNMFSDESYRINLYTSPDQITPKIINGEVDAAAVPSNLAAVLFNKMKGGIKVAAVNTTGVLYILENGDTVNSISDLEGKTVYATGQGATPEYVLQRILDANGLTDVTVRYMGAHADLAGAMASGDVNIALLPEPFVSSVLTRNSNIKVKIDINEAWKDIYGEDAGMPMGVTVVSNTLAGNSDAMQELIDDWSDSATHVISDPQGVSADIAKNGIVSSADIAALSIPRCGISFITGDACKSMLKDYFDVMYDANPASLGGAIPGDSFYYMP